MNQTAQTSTRVQNLGSFVWSIAEILRSDFKQSDYGKVILPFIVMRRFDCILEAAKPAILAAEKSLPEGIDDETRDMILFGAAGDNIRVYWVVGGGIQDQIRRRIIWGLAFPLQRSRIHQENWLFQGYR